jgi:catechol 2,3-dioxygenase-like lactoylglutathione lyase family enzyme
MKLSSYILVALLVLGIATTAISKNESNFSSPLIGVGVICSDLDSSLKFYTELVGMVKVGGFDVDADFAKRSGLSNGKPFSVAVLKLEDSEQANQWKLMSFGTKSAHSKQNFIQDDLGMQYITIMVKHLKPIIKRLKAANVKFLGDTPTQLNGDTQFLFVQDPDGNFVELIGPM